MKDFTTWLNESVLPSIQRALHILRHHKNRQDLVNRIQAKEPYRDKRFAPIIARWIVDHGITPEEHVEDVKQFKELHKRLKSLRIPANNRERTALVKDLLSRKPEDFAGHYSDLQDWNRRVSDILDPENDLSDEGLPIEMRHNGYTMYRIDKKEHCMIPIVKNSMSWCVTKNYFGKYGGPPYYPVIRDRDRKPFAMIIPAHFDMNPDQAVRNANNDDRLSPEDLRLIRPLVQHVLPLDKHSASYIKGVHGLKPELPENSSTPDILSIMKDYALVQGEWPEGELLLSQDAQQAYRYARFVVKGPWRPGEKAISQDPNTAVQYAKDVLRAPFPAGEQAISQDSKWAYQYAYHVIKGPWSPGERSISQDPGHSFAYAKYVIKGPWSEGERAIAQDSGHAVRYAHEILKARFPAGEEAISQRADHAYHYARDVVKGRWEKGEEAISQDPNMAYHYARDIIKGPWPPGEEAIDKDDHWASMYRRFRGIMDDWKNT